MRFINYALYGALFAITTLGLGFFLVVSFGLTANPLPANFSDFIPKAYIVQSGSMEPAIKVGSVVIVQKSDIYSPNDVITFGSSPNDKSPTTHRIHFKEYPEGINGPVQYLTAGDANEDFDTNKVKEEQIVGKVVFTLPYAGYIADFAKGPTGFILLVIVPATIIIYEELKFLKREFGKNFGKFWTKIRKKKINVSINLLPPKEARPLHKASILIPIIGSFLVIASLSLAYFFDLENSVGNIFGAGIWSSPTPTGNPSPSPTPTPGVAVTLVINEVLPDTSCFIGPKEAQWIEVYNGYSTTVDLKNFSITDGTNTIDLVTAVTNVPAGQFALIAHDNSTWTQCYNKNAALTANFGGGTFNVDTGTLQLLDPSDVIIDTVIWGSNSLTPAQNESIERNPDGFDSAFGTNFAESDFIVQPTPQPGL